MTRLGLLFATLSTALTAGDLDFSDPAKQALPPRNAAGYPSRAPDLDVLPGFAAPPPGYGEVAFYWWLGDPLTRERLSWQVDQLKNRGIAGLQINYAHSDKGGRSWGLTYPSDPPLFSAPWWNLFDWFLTKAGGAGMAVSLSDYTLGPGQGWYFDEAVKDVPGMNGAVLDHMVRACRGREACSWQLPEGVVSVAAYGNGSLIDLRPKVRGTTLEWRPPAGDWQVIAVFAKTQDLSMDPMHPLSGRKTIEKFFQRFEDRNPGSAGKALNFFFSDELNFGVRGNLWNSYFAAEFRKRKGYDIVPELAALYIDIGPRTPKIRLDYSDTLVALEEENFFRPLYEWHRQRGMLYGCDHGGRGRDVVEFGDYFRTQRWMTGPGNDNPNLASDIVKNKVASSITHLYQRPRTWLEGYYGSGWGTTSAEVADATWRNFVMGHNLLTLHGLYYSTHGGWWEWAPPCNHYHMPYWAHMEHLLRASERLSYLLSQGTHRADIAVMYPVAPMEAGLGGKESVDTAFELGRRLYSKGVDFDFMDFESLARAKVDGGMLKVSGEEYRVLVLPAMRAVRHSTLEKAAEFHRAGGTVLIVGAPPEASERMGRGDPEVAAMVRELSNGAVSGLDAAESRIAAATARDYSGEGYVLHRKAGVRDIYMVYGAPKHSECFFRAKGKAELWDPWTGRTSTLPVLAQTAGGTRISMPLDRTEPQLIVFSPGQPEIAPAGGVERPARIVPIDGAWEFELKPTLDNRFGDYRLPATNSMIGAEARRFRYSEETAAGVNWQLPSFDDSKWQQVTYSYGPHFWKLGPLPDRADEAALSRLTQIDPGVPVVIGSKQYRWQPYEFSMRFGVEDDPGHEGYHGLKGELTDDFIALGMRKLSGTSSSYEAESAGMHYYLWTSVESPTASAARAVIGGMEPSQFWLNGSVQSAASLSLKAGSNPLLLRYDHPGRAHFLIESAAAPAEWKQPVPLAMSWFGKPGILPLDTRPQTAHPVGWYRFLSAPGLQSMTLNASGKVQAWANGKPLIVEAGSPRIDIAAPSPLPALIALRIEQQRGEYGGAAILDPIQLDCRKASTEPGDWSKIDGLSSYSGGAWYRKTLTLAPSQARGRVILDLGQVVSSAEVRVNGKLAGVKLAPPWKVDLSSLVTPGANRIEILVYNTLANHYQTIPTRYRGSPVSGLLGPVTLETY